MLQYSKLELELRLMLKTLGVNATYQVIQEHECYVIARKNGKTFDKKIELNSTAIQGLKRDINKALIGNRFINRLNFNLR